MADEEAQESLHPENETMSAKVSVKESSVVASTGARVSYVAYGKDSPSQKEPTALLSREQPAA